MKYHNIPDRKSIIRNKMRMLRDRFNIYLRKKYDKMIYKKVISLDLYKTAKTVMFYVSFGSEVDTHRLINKSLNDGKIVVVPKIINKKIVPSQIYSLNGLKKNKYGILEPPIVEKINIDDIDIVFVPGICFDKFGNRIGFGGGYYDEFLKKIDFKKRIGLGYSFQIINTIPTNKKDIKVSKIITENRIITNPKKKGVITCKF